MGLETEISNFCSELHNLLERFRHVPAHQLAARMNDKAGTLQTGAQSTLNAGRANASDDLPPAPKPDEPGNTDSDNDAGKNVIQQAADDAMQPDNPAAQGLDEKSLPEQH